MDAATGGVDRSQDTGTRAGARAPMPARRTFRRSLRIYARLVFPKGPSPHRVALAVFLGVFIGVLPTLGVALLLTALAASLCRVPKGPALTASFVATPPTLFLFFYPLGHALGCALLEPPPIDFDFIARFQQLNVLNAEETLRQLWTSAKEHVVAFWLGMIPVSAVTGAIGYVLTFAYMARRRRVRAAPPAATPQRSALGDARPVVGLD